MWKVIETKKVKTISNILIKSKYKIINPTFKIHLGSIAHHVSNFAASLFLKNICSFFNIVCLISLSAIILPSFTVYKFNFSFMIY